MNCHNALMSIQLQKLTGIQQKSVLAKHQQAQGNHWRLTCWMQSIHQGIASTLAAMPDVAAIQPSHPSVASPDVAALIGQSLTLPTFVHPPFLHETTVLLISLMTHPQTPFLNRTQRQITPFLTIKPQPSARHIWTFSSSACRRMMGCFN